MADIIPTEVDTEDAEIFTWATLTSTDVAGSRVLPTAQRGAFATATFDGTFDGATAVLQGSNDGTNWHTLKDPQNGTAISLTAAGYAEVSTAMSYIKPSTSGGGASQDIDCVVMARG